MTDTLSIINELGDDTDLLLAPDAWLENQRITLQQRLSLLAEQLDGILVAQRIKGQLQQRNLVAVRYIEKTNDVPSDIVIKVCPITDALAQLDNDQRDQTIPSDVSENSARQQIGVWRSDGYDVETTALLNRWKQARH